jgi:hypothetical protein
MTWCGVSFFIDHLFMMERTGDCPSTKEKKRMDVWTSGKAMWEKVFQKEV